MRLRYKDKKAAQAAAYLVYLHKAPINVISLLKMLYLADRKALVESGYPITGDTMVCMDHGPVLSRTYDLIKWNYHKSVWYDYLTARSNNKISLAVEAPPDQDELSDYEITVLNEIHKTYGQLDPFKLSEITHRLPEYVNPDGSSISIEPADILRAEGKSDQEVERLTHEAEQAYQFGNILHGSTTRT